MLKQKKAELEATYTVRTAKSVLWVPVQISNLPKILVNVHWPSPKKEQIPSRITLHMEMNLPPPT